MSQQSVPGGGQRGARLREALAALDLTADQQQKVREVIQKAMASGGAGGGRGAIFRDLATVLTPEQTSKLRERFAAGA